MDMTTNSTATGRARLGPKGRVTIPKVVRERLGIENGDELMFRSNEDTIEIVPLALVPRDQVWFYTTGMQARVLEAERDIEAGRTKRVSSVEELRGHLEELGNADE